MKKSIVSNREYCYICEMYKGLTVRGTELHHMCHGQGRRKLADADGLTVRLCHTCHTLLHDHGVHDRDLQQIAERTYLEHYNKTVDDFIARYGKNYLD